MEVALLILFAIVVIFFRSLSKPNPKSIENVLTKN